jgi:hypothetical protein
MDTPETAFSHNIREGVGISEFREYESDERLKKFLDAPRFEKLKHRPKIYKPSRKHPK